MKKWLVTSLVLNFIILVLGFWGIQKLGGWTYLQYKMNNRGLSAVYGHRVDLFERLELPEGCIVLLGNSLTQQAEWSELLSTKVYNRGIGGDGIQGLLNRLETITKAKPRQVFLMIGINDLITNSPALVLQQYQLLLQRFQHASPQTKLFVQSLLPVNNEVRLTGFRSADILLVNEGLHALSDELGLSFVNLHSIFCDKKGQLKSEFTSDGIHLSGAGYILWAEAINPLLIPAEEGN